jgi:hypothetical protein
MEPTTRDPAPPEGARLNRQSDEPPVCWAASSSGDLDWPISPALGVRAMLRFKALLSACTIVTALPACHQVVLAPVPKGPVIARKAGPPPHAPAHGYRRKHPSGAELRFDARLDVYTVVGRADVYFHDGWFIRIQSGIWQVSATLNGPWEPRDASWVPPGLRSKYQAENRKGRGHGAAKGAW